MLRIHKSQALRRFEDDPISPIGPLGKHELSVRSGKSHAIIRPMELIDYVEQQGLANYQWQQRVNETTRQESNITLGFLITGGAACMAWSVTQFCTAHGNIPLATAALVTGMWLFLLAGCVQFRCLSFNPASPPANHPLNLYQPEYNCLSLRVRQLENLEAAILQVIENGQERAKSLMKMRMFACITPLVFLAAWSVASACSLYFR